MGNSKERILMGTPGLELLRNAPDLVLGRKPILDRRAHEPGLQDPSGPALGKQPDPLTGIAPVIPRGVDLVGREAGLARPHVAVAAGVGLAAVGLRDGLVQLGPARQLARLRIPREGAVVGLARGDNPAPFRHPPHLPQNPNGIRHVLQHLVARHDVEAVVWVR